MSSEEAEKQQHRIIEIMEATGMVFGDAVNVYIKEKQNDANGCDVVNTS